MTILRDISVIYSLVFVVILFLVFFESRYSKKKTIIATAVFMGIWLLAHAFLLMYLGPFGMTKIIVVTGTIPSFIFFWIMSKYRDGRLVFTFCFCDTISAEVLAITNLIDFYLFGETFISMLILRLIVFPLLALYCYRVLRPLLLEVQRSVDKDWNVFAMVTAVFYLALVVSSSIPTAMTERPDVIPTVIMILILMPMMYGNIFSVLSRQQKIFEMTEQDNILKLQIQNMQSRMEQFDAANDQFRIERHDMRHKLRTIDGMIEAGQYEEVREYLSFVVSRLSETSVKHYCENPVLDAVLASYLRHAESLGIEVRADLAIPAEPGVEVTALSTVFANAIENAASACEKLPPKERFIEIRAITHPQFMFQIINPYKGKITLDERGIPIASKREHGFGTRSIVAFCDKYGAFYEFKTENNLFVLRIVIDN